MTLEKAKEIIKEISEKKQSMFHIERDHYNDFEDFKNNGLEFDKDNTDHIELVTEILGIFYFDILNFCGCGMPEKSCDYLLALLSLYYIGEKDKGFLTPRLFGGDFVVDMKLKYNLSDERLDFILKLLDSYEMTEHGSGVYGSWLTGYGMLVKNLLQIRKDLDLTVVYVY